MAASKRARDTERPKPINRESVPVSGGAATPGEGVGRRRKGSGEAPQGGQEGAEVLPGLPQEPPPTVVSHHPNHPSNDTSSWRSAITRASAEDYWQHATWNPRISGWVVPSSTDPTVAHIVRRDRRLAGQHVPTWEHFLCSCVAGQRGFLVCLHKAAVWLKRKWMAENLVGPFAEK